MHDELGAPGLHYRCWFLASAYLLGSRRRRRQPHPNRNPPLINVRQTDALRGSGKSTNDSM